MTEPTQTAQPDEGRIEMTDNEKAATFIGWKPGQLCKDRECPINRHSHSWGVTETHDVECPDMSDPRNYMKALLATSGFIIDFASELGGFPWWSVEIWRDSDRIALGESRESMADAAIKGLAALWDAEHPS